MDEIEIRNVKKGDEKTLAYIQTESWKAAFAEILSPEIMNAYTDINKIESMYQEVLHNKLANGILLTANGMPHGTAFWGRCREKKFADSAELICIHSLSDKWHKGFGSMLMEHVLAEMKEAHYKEAVLWVFEENMRARKFYEKHGFEATEHSKYFLGAKEVLYVKSLFENGIAVLYENEWHLCVPKEGD